MCSLFNCLFHTWSSIQAHWKPAVVAERSKTLCWSSQMLWRVIGPRFRIPTRDYDIDRSEVEIIVSVSKHSIIITKVNLTAEPQKREIKRERERWWWSAVGGPVKLAKLVMPNVCCIFEKQIKFSKFYQFYFVIQPKPWHFTVRKSP